MNLLSSGSLVRIQPDVRISKSNNMKKQKLISLETQEEYSNSKYLTQNKNGKVYLVMPVLMSWRSSPVCKIGAFRLWWFESTHWH